MKYSELLTAVAVEATTDHRVVEKVLKAYVATVLDEVRRGNVVTHRSFGTYYAGKFTARTGKSPRTGLPVFMPGRNKLRLRVAAVAEAQIN